MADIYCDPDVAGPGTGTELDPYEDFATAYGDASAGDTVWLANTVAAVLTSAVAGTSGTQDAPIIIRAWDRSGAITIALPSVGGAPAATRVAGEINGDDAVANIFSGNFNYNIWIGIKMHSTTSNLVRLGTGSSLIECELWDASGTYMALSAQNTGHVYRTIFRDSGGTGVDGLQAQAGIVYGCCFSNITGSGLVMGTYTTVAFCTIKDCEENGIVSSGKDSGAIFHCTIDGNATSDAGISLAGTGTEMIACFHNLITNFSATGADGIQAGSGSNFWILGPNDYYNNDIDEDVSFAAFDASSDNESETSDPYVDRSSDDLELLETADGFGSAPEMQTGASGHKMSYGAIQKVQAGGGGGQTAHTF